MTGYHRRRDDLRVQGHILQLRETVTVNRGEDGQISAITWQDHKYYSSGDSDATKAEMIGHSVERFMREYKLSNQTPEDILADVVKEFPQGE